MRVQVDWLTFHSLISSLLSHDEIRLNFLGWKSTDITCSVCPSSLDIDLLGYNDTIMVDDKRRIKGTKKESFYY